MKSLYFLVIILIMYILPCIAQSYHPLNIDSIGLQSSDVIAQMKANLSPADTLEGGPRAQVGTLERMWQSRAVSNTVTGSNMYQQYFSSVKNQALVRNSQNCGTGFHGSWYCLGPDSIDKQVLGYINAVWADPTDTNYILAATWGGLFKTINGGITWVCITDNAPLVGGALFIEWIAVNPLNKNTIYLGTSSTVGNYGVNNTSTGWGYGGVGILKSFNGGTTWQQEIIPIDSYPYNDSVQAIQKIYFTPDTGRLYAFCGNRAFTRNNYNTPGAWYEITPDSVSPNTTFYDLEFVPNHQDHFFIANRIAADGSKVAIYETTTSVPNSSDWKKITTGFSDVFVNSNYPLDTKNVTDVDLIAIDVSIPDEDTLFAAFSADSWFMGLYKYNISGSVHSWTRLNNSLPGAVYPTWQKNVLAVSNAITSGNGGRRNIYFGSDILSHSYDGGYSFRIIGTYGGSPTHGDIRGLHLHSSNTLRGIGDRLYVANDGGVSVKYAGVDDSISGAYSTANINGKGLACGTFWSVSTSEEGGIAMAAAMHNGTMGYEPKQSLKWKLISDAEDNYITMFDMSNRSKGYRVAGFGYTYRNSTMANAGRIMDMANVYENYPPDVESHDIAPPMVADDENKHFVGHQKLWSQSSPSSSWDRPFSGLPADGTVFDIAYSPHDTGFTGYLLYGRANKLYKRFPLTDQDFKIIPNVPGVPYYSMSCITTDPDNPQRVWVGIGGVSYVDSTPTHNRVVYSPDAGSTWIDISYGLPRRVPVTKIIYHEGNNTLYCATDVGIYKCNFNTYNPASTVSDHNHSVQWECFSKGKVSGKDFPNVVVTQLKINACDGKLYASTYGRSIWVSDLMDDSLIKYPLTGIDVTTNTTWASSKYIASSIRIRPGVTLTIQGSNTIIHMPKNGLIKVDSGAYLIVDSATITNGCEECMWEGIQVGGRHTISQLPNLQGRVWLKDATIEHAKNAISNSFDGYLWNTGGIVRADRTKFLNNKKSVVLMNYSSSAKYAASFRQCTFEVTEDYKGGTDNKFQAHVDLNRVDGPTFYGCNFYYRLDPTGVNRGQGYGIRSTDAGFSIKPHCASTLTTPCSYYVRSNFKGFLYGVYADRSVYGAYSFTVDRATFDSCSFGIRMYNLWGIPVITRDSFHVGHGVDSYIGFDCHRNVGIFSTGCGGYVIQDNDFKGYTDNGWQHAQHQNWGTLIEDGGELDNQVYRCSFRELDRANVSWGKNASPYNYATSSGGSTWTGLRYVCNTFVNDTTDIHVEGENYRGGIAAWQGNFTKPAGNSFGSGSHNHIRIINTPYPVYFYQNSGTQNPVNPSPGYSNKIAISNSNSCPVLTDDWNLPLGPDTKVNIKSTFAAGKVALGDLQATYAGYIDGGGTSTLVSYINGSTSSDAVAVKATLLSYSPYLSTTAIKAVADKDILSKPDLITVLEANPDLLRYPELLSYLQNEIPNPLDNGQINTLIFASQDTSARTILEANMSKQAADNQMIANFLLADMQLDSANTDIDSIPVWYNNINSLSAEYAKVGYYTGRGDYTNAASVLDGIPAKFSLTEEESTELENYIDFWTIIKDAKLDGRSIHQLNSTEIANLATLNEGSFINDRVNVGTTVVNLPPDEPIRIPCVRSVFYGWNKQGATSKNQNSKKRVESIKIVRAYPNPADDKVIFDYTLPSNVTGSMSISVTNMVGQKVKELPLNNTSGRVQWDTKAVQPGVYVYKVYDRKNTIETGKLIISR